MVSPAHFREIVSGRRSGPGATLVRWGLHAASVPYGWAIRLRNRRFDRGGGDIQRPPVPVISVGNLTVGGTGKTPLVEWLCRHLRRQGVRAAILSRGYGAEWGDRNDEALELELSLPDVPHLQNPDRAAAAAVAVDELASQLLVLDDGFQHRRLARDLDVVLLDASEPFGFDRLLPRGLLREPVSGLRRAGAIVLSRADMIDAQAREAIRRRAQVYAPQAAWCEVVHRPAALVDSAGADYPLADLHHRPVAAFCGIGNPAGFRHTLDSLGCRIVAWHEFPDHHAYRREDVEMLGDLVRTSGAALAVCTRKDLVKLRAATLGNAPLRSVAVELHFLAGQDALEQAVAPLVERARDANNTWRDWESQTADA